MPRFTNSHDTVTTTAADAQHAANIVARRIYGRRGYCRTLRHDCRTEDGRNHTWEAFVGVSVGGGTTSGRNVWIFEQRDA